MSREDIAEWLAYHLTVERDCLDGYDLDTLKVLDPYKREMLLESMPTLQCLDNIIPGLYMDFMPLELLYDLYDRWCEKRLPLRKAAAVFASRYSFTSAFLQFFSHSHHEMPENA